MNKRGITGIVGFLLNPKNLIIFGIIAIVYFGFFYTGSIIGSNCNLGSWGVSSYNPSTKELVIGYSGNVHSSGCFGTYNVGNKGSPIPSNQKDCEEIGWTWYLGGEDGNCRLTDLNWMKDKTYISTGICTHSIQTTCCSGSVVGSSAASTYCGPLCGGSASETISPGFSGTTIDIGDMKRQLGDSVSCSGTITIKPKEIKTETPTFSTSPETEAPIINEEENTITETLECLANLDCIKICGELTPTCISNKCYCDAKRTENDDKITITRKITIFDKISIFIQGIFDKIFGVFR